MTAAAFVFAALAALLHVYIWTMESLTWRKPATWKRFGLASQDEAEITAPLAYNQGFYNLFLAIGTGVGVALGCWALIYFGAGCMLAAALVLASTGKKYLRGAVLQGTFPALAIVFALLA